MAYGNAVYTGLHDNRTGQRVQSELLEEKTYEIIFEDSEIILAHRSDLVFDDDAQDREGVVWLEQPERLGSSFDLEN